LLPFCCEAESALFDLTKNHDTIPSPMSGMWSMTAWLASRCEAAPGLDEAGAFLEEVGDGRGEADRLLVADGDAPSSWQRSGRAVSGFSAAAPSSAGPRWAAVI